MRENYHKKAFGLVGLGAVALMTTVAASLPTPDANAVTSVSDTITVTVVTDRPEVNITSLDSMTLIWDGIKVTDNILTVAYSYVNVDHISIDLSYEPLAQMFRMSRAGANWVTENLLDTDVRQTTELTRATLTGIDLNDYRGYGDYTVTITGRGYGVEASTSYNFSYNGVVVDDEKVETDTETGNPTIDIEVSGDTEKVEIDILDKDGNKVNKDIVDGNGNVVVSGKIECKKNDLSNCKIPFSDYGLEDGDYTIVITPLDGDGNVVGTPIKIEYTYTAVETPDAPKTGSIFQSLNIASKDYIMTGVVVFGLAMVTAAVMIHKRKNSRRR